MTRITLALAGSLVAAAAMVAAQGTTGQTSQTQPQTPDTTVTGCLIQGSTPSTFLLDNARINPKDQAEKGRTYRLVAATEDLAFQSYLNHEVGITGAPEIKTVPAPAAGQKVKDEDLPRLQAKFVTPVADTCSTPKGR